MKECYRIKRIEEPDFGCEGRPEGEKIRDLVILEAKDGSEKMVKAEDVFLYQQNIQEGDRVILGENGKIQKVMSDEPEIKSAAVRQPVPEFYPQGKGRD